MIIFSAEFQDNPEGKMGNDAPTFNRLDF